jgi:hypothetical protein
MTTEEIITIAEGIGLHYYVNEMAGSYVERLERFAAVVASIERERCAMIADSMDALQDGAIGKAIRSRQNNF